MVRYNVLNIEWLVKPHEDSPLGGYENFKTNFLSATIDFLQALPCSAEVYRDDDTKLSPTVLGSILDEVTEKYGRELAFKTEVCFAICIQGCTVTVHVEPEFIIASKPEAVPAQIARALFSKYVWRNIND